MFHGRKESEATGAIRRDDRGQFVAASLTSLMHMEDTNNASRRNAQGLEIRPREMGCNVIQVQLDLVEVIS